MMEHLLSNTSSSSRVEGRVVDLDTVAVLLAGVGLRLAVMVSQIKQ